MKKSTLFFLILLLVAVTACKTTQVTTEYNDPEPSVTDVIVPDLDVVEEPIMIETAEEEVVVEVKEEFESEVKEEEVPVKKTVKEPEETGAYKNIEVIRYKLN